jgi:hypothetical protein
VANGCRGLLETVTTSIPLWVPLVVAILGLIGTAGGAIAGVVITQRRSDRRENTAWQRERDRERERWAREDAARTFEQRREAYSDFYESLRDMGRTVYDYGMGLPGAPEGPNLPFDWNRATFRKLQHLGLYASSEVANAAAEAYSICLAWGKATAHERDDADFYEYQEANERATDFLLTAIRSDLAVHGPDDVTGELEH